MTQRQQTVQHQRIKLRQLRKKPEKTTPTSHETTPTLSRGVSNGEERKVNIPLPPYSSLSSWAMQLANPPNPSDQSHSRWNPWRRSHSSTKKWSLSSSWVRNWYQNMEWGPEKEGGANLGAAPDTETGREGTKAVVGTERWGREREMREGGANTYSLWKCPGTMSSDLEWRCGLRKSDHTSTEFSRSYDFSLSLPTWRTVKPSLPTVPHAPLEQLSLLSPLCQGPPETHSLELVLSQKHQPRPATPLL